MKGQRRPKAARRQGTCWGCQKPGHLRRHCPLKKVEDWPREVPGGPEGALLNVEKVTPAEGAIVGTPQEAGTQIIPPPVIDRETQTEWAQQEAGAQEQRVQGTKWTQVVMGQATKGTQTLREEGLGDSNLWARLEAAERALRESEASGVELAKEYAAVVDEEVRLRKLLQDSEKKRVALEACGRLSQAKKPPYPQGWGF